MACKGEHHAKQPLHTHRLCFKIMASTLPWLRFLAVLDLHAALLTRMCNPVQSPLKADLT